MNEQDFNYYGYEENSQVFDRYEGSNIGEYEIDFDVDGE